ncbi:MAG: hypothetical protein HYX57_01810 [Chloroflexi bacterium]|nr:hypothetical protein [Chloroflexota bacterium]
MPRSFGSLRLLPRLLLRLLPRRLPLVQILDGTAMRSLPLANLGAAGP